MFPSSGEGKKEPTLLGPLERPNLYHWRLHVKVKVILRPTVSRPVCLGARHLSGTRDQFFSFCVQLFLDSCGFVDVTSLTRSRACSFQFLLDIASGAFLRSLSHGTHEHSLLSPFLRLPQPGLYLFPPGTE
jgi:hypothetical protein